MQDGNQNEPGWVFKPGDSTAEPNSQQAQSAEVPTPVEPQQPPTQPQPSPRTEDLPAQQEPQGEMPRQNQKDLGAPQVEWTASEYIDHQRSAGWFGLLIAGSVVLAGVTYILADLISAIVILMLGIIVGVFANHKPRSLNYQLGSKGVNIGEKFYPYSTFKSFSVGQEQAMKYISLMPVRRFMPPLSIHYAEADEDNIVNTLADYLPFEEHQPDMVDRLSKRFRL